MSSYQSIGFSTVKRWHLFLWGSIATCIGEIVTLPIDVVKVRMQTDIMLMGSSSRGMIGTFLYMLKTEGVMSLYAGLSPAVLRQFLYGGLRTGLYEPLKEMLNGSKKETINDKLSFWKKVIAGGLAGAISAGICTPTDVIKIRMQAGCFSKKYDSTLGAFLTIIREEGLRGIYKGTIPTSQRAAIIACTELSIYDESKHWILKKRWIRDGFPTHFVASLICGLVATFLASPIDYIKTNLQAQPIDSNTGRGIYYKSSYDCFKKTIQKEGVFALWRGVVPHYLRRGPHLVVTFSVLEQLRYYGDKYL